MKTSEKLLDLSLEIETLCDDMGFDFNKSFDQQFGEIRKEIETLEEPKRAEVLKRLGDEQNPGISFQTRLYSCPFCPRDEAFVVDHPLELSRHMLKEHKIYFNDYVSVIKVNKVSDTAPVGVNQYTEVSDRFFDEAELEAFRRILRDWIDEGFTMPPYDPPIQRVIDKLGVEG